MCYRSCLLTYLFRLCFNQCNASLHFGSSKHSCQKQSCLADASGCMWLLKIAWSALITYFCLRFFYHSKQFFQGSWVLLQWHVSMFISTVVFCCMLSLRIGTRPDGSAVVLARPHGRPSRVGSLEFRAVFLTFGRHRTPRTCIFIFLYMLEWHSFISSNGRLYLFLTCFSSSAVTTPRVEPVPTQIASAPASEDSDSDAESV